MLKKSIIGLGLTASMLMFSGCLADKESTTKRAVDGGAKYEVKDGKYTAYHVNTQNVEKYNKGRLATKTEIAAWNVDVMPDGTGLPIYDTKHGKILLDENGEKIIAQGTVGLGYELYDAQCVMCHGDFGSGGIGGYPAVAGRDIKSLTNQLQNPADDVPGVTPPSKRIGSYWPYASTLFWYIQDAMPYPHPKSLSNSDTYAISAYLLMENGILIDGESMDDDFVMNREQFLKIKMPNEKGFYPKVDTPNDPAQGVRNMTEYLGNAKNYGTGTRCMSDCIKGEIPLLRIKNELNNFNPPASTKRDLPVVEKIETVQPGQVAYENKCSACHANAAIGAPVLGDKNAWSEVTAKGLDKVYHNSINGINGMPPKGGNMDLSDSEMKVIVDYMINSSK
jgi:cytochrome c